MSRIVYLAFPSGDVAGGQKMILRHVETLRELGFEAVCWLGSECRMPFWLEHRAPVEQAAPFRPDDILVIPDDAPNALATLARRSNRCVVFCQSAISLAVMGAPSIDLFPADRFPPVITVGPGVQAAIRRIFPQADVHLAPCFADERIFRRENQRQHRVAHWPRKRPPEAMAIRALLPRLHPRHAALPFVALERATERQVAEAFGRSTLFLSLSRMESVGMTPLEAMASGCLVAGFTGIGGRDYATPDNGFWVEEDHVFAAADALAEAADLIQTGGPALLRMWEAGRATAEAWSYARFRVRLEEVWMTLAPEARLQDGPLDAA
jgi:glycosyltransferase involved in cell wall biosynthesis